MPRDQRLQSKLPSGYKLQLTRDIPGNAWAAYYVITGGRKGEKITVEDPTPIFSNSAPADTTNQPSPSRLRSRQDLHHSTRQLARPPRRSGVGAGRHRGREFAMCQDRRDQSLLDRTLPAGRNLPHPDRPLEVACVAGRVGVGVERPRREARNHHGHRRRRASLALPRVPALRPRAPGSLWGIGRGSQGSDCSRRARSLSRQRGPVAVGCELTCRRCRFR